MNIYEQQQANRKRTWLIVAVFIVFFAFLGLGFDYFYLGYDPWTTEPGMGMPFPLATIFSIVFSSGWAWWGMLYGDRAVLTSSGALRIDQVDFTKNNPGGIPLLPPSKPLQSNEDTEESSNHGPPLTLLNLGGAPPKADNPKADSKDQREQNQHKYQQLLNVVEEMCIASGLPKPKVYLILDPDPNAFATGRDPEHSSIAVTQGLLDKLNREELQGVIAHEMSHVRNLDIRLMTTIAALVGAVVLLSDWAMRGMRSDSGRSRSSSKKGGGGGNLILFAIWLLLVILAPLLAQLLAMAVSRQRESLADASGAELTRNPGALASALKKIEMEVAPTGSIKRGSAHLCIADPLGRKMGLRQGFWGDLLATHPPMHERINALKLMAYQGPEPSPANL